MITYRMHCAACSIALVSAVACSSSNNGPSSFDNGNGNGNDGGSLVPGDDGGSPGTFGDGSTPPSGGASGTLTFVVHDFKLYNASDPTTNPDFENVPKKDQQGNPNPNYLGPWDDKGIVEDTLGSDGAPVYKSGATSTMTTHGKAAFDQWYHDVAGTNVRILVPITLTKNADGTYGYDSQISGVPYDKGNAVKMFFPIDDGTPYASPFGQQGDLHNYSFTCEVHTTFTYRGGEFLHYRGYDDVWVFIDGKRVIDLGGIHDPETGDVQLDSLGLTKGQTYPLDWFFAERHKGGSNVLMTTSIQLHDAPK